MNQLELPSLQVTNQPPPKRQFNLRDFLIEALNDFYAKLIAIFTSVYVTVMFLKILGIIHEPIIPDPFNTLIIALIILYFTLYVSNKIYKSMKYRYKDLTSKIRELTEQNINLTSKIGELTEQNINLTSKIEELTNEIKSLTISKPKDPAKLIDDHLVYPDVKFAIYCLSKKIEESGFFGDKDANGRYNARKNIIVGIDRGVLLLGVC